MRSEAPNAHYHRNQYKPRIILQLMGKWLEYMKKEWKENRTYYLDYGPGSMFTGTTVTGRQRVIEHIIPRAGLPLILCGLLIADRVESGSWSKVLNHLGQGAYASSIPYGAPFYSSSSPSRTREDLH